MVLGTLRYGDNRLLIDSAGHVLNAPGMGAVKVMRERWRVKNNFMKMEKSKVYLTAIWIILIPCYGIITDAQELDVERDVFDYFKKAGVCESGGTEWRILQGLRLGEFPEERMLSLLQEGVKDVDPCLSQAAGRILKTWERNLSVRGNELPSLFLDLKDDAIYANAVNAYGILILVLRKNIIDPKSVIALLEKTLESADYQQRQYVALILTQFYKNQNIELSQWPDALFDCIIEGLGEDDLRGYRGFANATMWFAQLYPLSRNRPVLKLKKALKEGDNQKRFLSALILAHYFENSVQPEISSELVHHLRDDHLKANAYAAYNALKDLGKTNLEEILRNHSDLDWQQAALLYLSAADFNIPCSPSAEDLDAWIGKAGDFNVNRDLFYYGADRRLHGAILCNAVLFIFPPSEAILKNNASLSYLKNLIASYGKKGSPHERSNLLKKMRPSLFIPDYGRSNMNNLIRKFLLEELIILKDTCK